MRQLAKLRFGGGLLVLSLVLAAWAAAHGVKSWTAPEEAKKLKNPVAATPESLAAAKTTYLDRCARCHGEQGKGDGPEAPMYSVKASDFTDAHMMGDMTDGEIFWKIGEGRRPMPSFRMQLSEEQRWQLVNLLRAFAAKPAPRSSHAPASKKSRSHRP
jgi:mono/diheme cytochrome c family protein